MCTTCVSARRSSCFRQQTSESSAQWRKKWGRNGPQRMTSRRTRRVTFSSRDYVLGTAQDYDRTSFEEEVESPPQITAAAAADVATTATARAAAATTTTAATDSSSVAPGLGTRDHSRANFCGIWRRSHGFNWAALLEFSGVDKAVIPEQVRLTHWHCCCVSRGNFHHERCLCSLVVQCVGPLS